MIWFVDYLYIIRVHHSSWFFVVFRSFPSYYPFTRKTVPLTPSIELFHCKVVADLSSLPQCTYRSPPLTIGVLSRSRFPELRPCTEVRVGPVKTPIHVTPSTLMPPPTTRPHHVPARVVHTGGSSGNREPENGPTLFGNPKLDSWPD